MQFVSDPADLRSLHPPVEGPPPAVRTALDGEDLDLLNQATLSVVSTVKGGGLSCSPRGGDAGSLVIAQDDRTLWLADRAVGRVHETVRNLMADPRIGLLLMAPGRHDTLRIGGTARVTADAEAVGAFATEGVDASSVLVVAVLDVRRSGRGPLRRAGLWGDRTG